MTTREQITAERQRALIRLLSSLLETLEASPQVDTSNAPGRAHTEALKDAQQLGRPAEVATSAESGQGPPSWAGGGSQ